MLLTALILRLYCGEHLRETTIELYLYHNGDTGNDERFADRSAIHNKHKFCKRRPKIIFEGSMLLSRRALSTSTRKTILYVLIGCLAVSSRHGDPSATRRSNRLTSRHRGQLRAPTSASTRANFALSMM